MKKSAFFMLSVLMCGMIFLGCSTFSKESANPGDNNEITQPIVNAEDSVDLADDDSKNDIGMGGYDKAMRENEYDLGYYGVETSFDELVGSDVFNAWIESCKNSDGNTRYEDYNVLRFIQNFNISKEDFLAVNWKFEEYPSYTNEQIDALYSGDKRQIAETFMNPNAILVDDEIYTPKWVITHSFEEIKAVGITEEVLEAKCIEWKETFGENSDIYTNAKARLDEYKAETISAQTE